MSRKTWRDRLEEARADAGLSVSELLRRAELKPTAWHDMMVREQAPSVDKLARIIAALGKSLDEIYHGDDADDLQLFITGASIGEGDMWEEVPAKAIRSVPVRMFAADYVSIAVDTSEYEPEYRRGDVLCGPRMLGKNLDNIVGQDCILFTDKGEKLLKTLVRGTKPNRYTLRSFRRSVDDMPDVKIDWAAPIRMILRGVEG